ncbi:T9SS type A sorting domain-containing protein [Psychroserpens sp.]|uniref:T9SS type A sorting domain-containing protein n=1 Tax=Psychroserpens sp. TaxID=2020870 RepID=UPI00385E31EA
MKQNYSLVIAFFISFVMFSQTYQFGIVHNSDYNFSIVAIPDFDATNTDVSDIGFALMLPTGSSDIINISQFNGRNWTLTEVTAAQLTTFGLGDGTRDGFVMNLPPGQTIFSHSNNVPFVLVTFDVSNMPTTGELELLSNTDPISLGLGGAVDSFYNSNIDNSSTQDYFDSLALGMETFMFDTLGVEAFEISTSNFNVYPNPTENYVTVDSNELVKYIELFNLLGELIIKESNKNIINLSHLSNGVYLLKVLSKDGREVTKKIIKH